MAGRQTIKILLIEDDEVDAREVAEMFSEVPEVPVDFTHVQNLTDGIRRLTDGDRINVVLLDLGLPESSGLETLDRLRAEVPDATVVVLTSADDREVGIAAVQHGAQDYLIKGKVDAGLMTRAVTYAIERHRMQLDLRRLTNELEQSNAELKRSNEELERFAYVVAHDLKAPLRTVTGFCHFLVEKTEVNRDEEADEFFGYVLQGTERMDAIIDDLLAYSRVDKAEKPPEATDFQEVFNRAVANLQGEIDESGATVTCDSLPTFAANKSQMLQVLQNLIGNAIKFRGNRPPKVHVGVEQQDGSWQFSVRDTGIGIERKQCDRIFEAFKRLHSQDEYEGTGIGLAICRKIVELYGGRVWVESTPGQGSTFYFTIAKREQG